MPQAPLPALANRLGQVPIFQPLNPGSYASNQPMNVLPYVQYPNMMDAALKGLQLGSGLAKLPQQGKEEATQMALQSIYQTQFKYNQQQIKAIMADKTLSPQAKTEAINQLIQGLGAGISGGQGTIDPQAAMANRYRQLEMELIKAQNPNLFLPTTNNPPAGGRPSNPPPPAPVRTTPSGSGQPQDGGNPPEPSDKDLLNQMSMVVPNTGTQLAYASPPPANFLQQGPAWNQVAGGYQIVPAAPIANGEAAYG
jgi:hypothetical protein